MVQRARSKAFIRKSRHCSASVHTKMIWKCIETTFGKAQLSDIDKRILVVDIWATAAKKRHNWDALTYFQYPKPNTMTLNLCKVVIMFGTRCARDSWLIGIGLPLNCANLGTFLLVL
jgi:hypothetical protein